AKKALEVKQTELDRARADAKSASAALAQARARREVSELRKRLANIREQERRAVEAQATIESITVSASQSGRSASDDRVDHRQRRGRRRLERSGHRSAHRGECEDRSCRPDRG